MSTGGRDEDEQPRGPELSEEQLRRLVEDFQRHHPDVLDGTLFPGGDGPPVDGPRLPSSPGRAPEFAPRRTRGLLALVLVAALVLAALVTGLPGRVVDAAYALGGDPGASLASAAPRTAGAAPAVRAPVPGGRLAPAVPLPAAPPAEEWTFMRTQGGPLSPVAFDPCRAIHYVVRTHPAVGTDGLDLVREAVAEVSAATGLVFAYDGTTDEAPAESRPASLPSRYASRYAPVLIAFSDPDESPRLAGDTAGFGGPVAVRDATGRLVYVSGNVVLDSPALSRHLGFLRRSAHARAIVMHELGHVVGATHPEDGSQLMAAENTGQTDWGDGDRYALALLGRGPCSPGL
jgi:hypothetical protein